MTRKNSRLAGTPRPTQQLFAVQQGFVVVPIVTAPITQFPVDRLFARLNLGPVKSVERLAGGQLNSAFRINGEWVLRCREAARVTGSLKREAAIIERLAGRVPTPEVHAQGLDESLGEYLLQRWVPGQNLFEAWLTTPDVGAREWWMRQFTASLQAIHQERYPLPGDLPSGELRPASSWRAYIEGRIRKRLDQLMRVPSMDRQMILAAEKYLRRMSPVLEDGPFCLIHRDLHFGNILVEGPKLTAILDFELAEVGPPDYELDTIYRFLHSPATFAADERCAGATPARFASVWARLKRGYPELFAARHLRERLSLYALDRDLSLLQQLSVGNGLAWRSNEGAEAAVAATVRHVADILQDRYGPE